MAFKRHIHLQLVWLQNLVLIDSESCQILFSSLCMQPSEVSLLFNSNLSRLPFLEQVVYLYLLLCTGFYLEHMGLFLCHISTQRQMNDLTLSETMGTALVSINFSPIPSKISLHMEKKVTHWKLSWTEINNLKSITVKLNQYCESGSTFSSSKPVAAQCPQRLPPIWNCQTLPSCARVLPQELGI